MVPLPATQLEIEGGLDEVRTGDVQSFTAILRDASGRIIDDVPVTWAHSYTPPSDIIAPSAPGQMNDGKFVADEFGWIFTSLIRLASSCIESMSMGFVGSVTSHTFIQS